MSYLEHLTVFVIYVPLALGASWQIAPGQRMSFLARGKHCSGNSTDRYVSDNCYQVDELENQQACALGVTDLSPSNCYDCCAQKSGATETGQPFYFGLEPSKCWCADRLGHSIVRYPCDQHCTGDDNFKCGGNDLASVYIMVKTDCLPQPRVPYVPPLPPPTPNPAMGSALGGLAGAADQAASDQQSAATDAALAGR